MRASELSPKTKTIAKWESIEGQPVLTVPAGSRDEAIEKLMAKVPDIITKSFGFGKEAVFIKLLFTAEEVEAAAARFDPRAKGLELVEKTKLAEGGAWSGSDLNRHFKLTPATLHRRRKEHRIVFWRDARHAFFYPKWQFTETGALLPGIEEVLGAFKSSDEWRIMRYFLTPRYQLGGKRPLDLLRAGEVEKVVPHAHAHAAEGSW